MPDWQAMARKHLSSLRLPAARQQEIVDKIAGYLEDHYEDLLRQGKTENESLRLAFAGLSQNDELTRQIRSALQENTVNHRVKAFWLPALAATVSALLLFHLMQFVAPPTARIPEHGSVPLILLSCTPDVL